MSLHEEDDEDAESAAGADFGSALADKWTLRDSTRGAGGTRGLMERVPGHNGAEPTTLITLTGWVGITKARGERWRLAGTRQRTNPQASRQSLASLRM